jgi:2-polyprenyl-6-methoxyphenol hydroxylase-like FAD-dependent oxidoreductase
MTSNKTNKSIAIIGGGPGGLMLGLLLQQQGYDYTIFEKAHPTVNSDRGGSLDIHDDSGQLPIIEMGIYERFKSLVRYEGEDTKVIAKDGTVIFEEDAEGEGGRPEIDRGELCDIILEQLDKAHIKYGYAFDSLEHLANKKVAVSFTNGEVEQFDLVVGADGAFSKVRPYLSTADIEYTGISMVEINIDDVKNNYPELATYNKNGKAMALGGNQALLAQLNGDGRIKVYVSYRAPKEQLDTYKQLSISELKAQLLSDFDDWHEDLKAYIHAMSDDVLFRRIYKLPIGFNWNHDAQVTMLGDAAHLMSPFAGEGVNTALYDAYIFVEALKANDDFDEAIRQYEQQMLSYAQDRAQESQDNLELMFAPDAAQQMGEFFNFVESEA